MSSAIWSILLLSYCLNFHHSVSAQDAVPTITLANGNRMPQIGMGTYQMTNESVLEQRIIDAIDIGYRHIDTALVYQNEWIVGKALKKVFASGKVKREDLFITTKVWSTHHKRNSVMNSAIISLGNLGLDYIDLLLVHWPMSFRESTGILRPNYNTTPADRIDTDVPLIETWRGMEDVLNRGLVRNIGVSNFNSVQLAQLLTKGNHKPVVNQIELNPLQSQVPLVDYCQSKRIAVTAYSPLGRAGDLILNDIVLNEIATKHNKTVPQVMLRWLIQRDIIAIPKTSKRQRLEENFNIFDFKLSDSDMSGISSLNKYKRIFDKAESKNNKEWPFNRLFR